MQASERRSCPGRPRRPPRRHGSAHGPIDVSPRRPGRLCAFGATRIPSLSNPQIGAHDTDGAWGLSRVFRGEDYCSRCGRSGPPALQRLTGPSLVSYRHGVGYPRSPGNLASRRLAQSTGVVCRCGQGWLISSSRRLLDANYRHDPDRSQTVRPSAYVDGLPKVAAARMGCCRDAQVSSPDATS